MSRTLKDQAVIVGIGQTEFSKNSGRSELQLAAECVNAAIQDAGLEPTQIDGLTTFTLDNSDEIEVARAVGCGDLTFYSRVNYGGGAALGIVHHAAMAVATGSANYAVGYRALNGRSGQRYSSGVSEGPTTSDMIHWSWYMPWGLMTPASLRWMGNIWLIHHCSISGKLKRRRVSPVGAVSRMTTSYCFSSWYLAI